MPVLLALSLLCAAAAAAQDLDHDGLSDALEQNLLERFLPTFVLSAGECDQRPAMFRPDAADPVVETRNGLLYGQVMPHPTPPGGPVEVEVKFFHLWARDCGRPSHALDAEHVSALVTAPSIGDPLDAWRARYWYAAAHEHTICDASSGASAEALRAATTGPYVYVSRGKHASYLDRGHCKWGCGSDVCDPGVPLPRMGVVNLGERDAPLNGARWIASGRWALLARLDPDFDAARRADLDRADPLRVAALRLGLRPWQAPILGGDTGLDALVAAGDAALTATAAATDATATAVEATGRAVGRALRQTTAGVLRFLRLR
ncbi:MAG: hypothetical protein OEW19_08510 [Acidobacteriota bacterium]|nr:hypothetical protein [Acidobacteriota bacterium]